MRACVSIPLDGGSILLGGAEPAAHPEHEHSEAQLTIHFPGPSAAHCPTRAWLVPSRMPHAGGWSRGTRSLVFHFDPDMLVEACDGASRPLFSAELFDPLLFQLGALALDEARAPAPDVLLLSSVHQVLAARLVRSHARAATRSSFEPLGERLVARLRELVESQIDRPLTVPEMARALRIRPQQLTRRLKAATGLSPHQFVLQMRVERAKPLLKDGRWPLAEIAFRLGFANQSHFTAVFRRHTGATPRAYRSLG